MKSSPLVAALIAATSLFANAQIATLVTTGNGVAVELGLSSGAVLARATTAEVRDLVSFELPDASGVAATWSEWTDGARADWQAISLDGSRLDVVAPIDRLIRLRLAAFDPTLREPAVPLGLRSAPGSRLWVVQWRTQGLEPYRFAIGSMGAEIHRYLPNHGQIVAMDSTVASAVSGLPYVRSVVPFHPAYKLDPVLLTDASPVTRAGAARVNILTMRRGMAGQAPVAQLIEELGGVVHEHSSETYLMSATVGPSQLVALARCDDVQWIDLWSEQSADMDVARQFVGAAWLESTIGFNGTGVRGEIYDIGTQLSHPELASPLAHGSVPSGSHGTSVAGQIFAQGLNSLARGMCPNGTAIVSDANAVGGSRYAHTMQSIDPAGPYRVVFLTSSVGPAQTTAYSSVSQNLDLIVFDSNLVHLQSQSNTGTQASRPEAWAKNVISVGGINHYGTVSDTDDAWTGASIGPAADGRMKPNLAAFYDSIYTTTDGSGYTGSFGGTSGATPIVAGAVGLLHEMWHAGAFGNGSGATVFDSRPKDTLVRALMFAAASAWDFEGTTDNLARSRQGWGRPNVERLYAERQHIHWVNETDVLTNLQSKVYYLDVLSGTPALRVSLVWADPAGTTNASQHRVNDLDLIVTSPSGTIYRGNFGLELGRWSVAGGSKDGINTEECVNVPAPTSGVWRIEVIAAEINQDGHVETNAIDVDFALAALGAERGTVPAPFEMRLSTTGSGVGDGLMGFDRIPVGTTEGFSLLSFATNGSVGSGPTAGLWPDALTITAVLTPMAPGNPFHWTAPASAGIFPAIDLTFPPGSITLPAGTELDGLGVALDAQGQVLGATPVRRIAF